MEIQDEWLPAIIRSYRTRLIDRLFSSLDLTIRLSAAESFFPDKLPRDILNLR